MSKLRTGLRKVYTHIRDMLRPGTTHHTDEEESTLSVVLYQTWVVLVHVLGAAVLLRILIGCEWPLPSRTSWGESEASWILAYLLLGMWLIVSAATFYNFVSKKGVSCSLMMQTGAAVYVLQVFGYLYYRDPHWMLFIPGVVILAWCVMAFGLPVLERLLPRKCATCGEAGSFLITSETPRKGGDKRRYCRTHFQQSLRRSLSRYKGRFIIVDLPPSHEVKSGQYFFYDPADLALDSYAESDIQAVQALIRSHLDPAVLPDGILAVKIPSDAVKEIGTLDDSPLLTRDTDAIEGIPMAFPDLMLYLESALSEFDSKGREFSMNKPYKQEGIYLWHGYL